MKDYQKIVELYFKTKNEFNEFESMPRDFGTGHLLYSSEIHTLQQIGLNPNINLTELAKKMGISKSGVSKFIKKLLEKDLIIKKKQDGNRKEVVFNLTDNGHVAYFGHEKFSKETFKHIFNLLENLEPMEIDCLETFFKKLYQELLKINKK